MERNRIKETREVVQRGRKESGRERREEKEESHKGKRRKKGKERC